MSVDDIVPAPRLEEESESALRLREVIAAERSADGDLAAARAQHEAAAAQREATTAQREAVKAQSDATRVQARATKVATIAALAAVAAVLLSAIGTFSTMIQTGHQGREERLAAALDAMGSDSEITRLGGLTLLQRNIEERVQLAESWWWTEADRANTVALTSSAITMGENFLKSPDELVVAGIDGGPRIGAGRTQMLPTAAYAVARIRALVDLTPRVNDLRASLDPELTAPKPMLDLSRAYLYRSRFAGFRLPDSLAGRNLAYADLRGSDLTGSSWPGASFEGAFLQCARADARTSFSGVTLRRADLRGADLSGADFSGADLTGADLRGANLERTDLSGARLDGVHADDAAGVPVGAVLSSSGVPPAFQDDQTACLARQDLWREQGIRVPQAMAPPAVVRRFLVAS